MSDFEYTEPEHKSIHAKTIISSETATVKASPTAWIETTELVYLEDNL